MKTVLITGCSGGGIGSAFAFEFAKRGFHVIATARNESKMQHFHDTPGIDILQLDPTSSASVEKAAKQVEKMTDGRLDILVNNAGQCVMSPILDADIDQAQAMFDINFWGALRTIQAFTPFVIAAKGTIVVNSTIGVVFRSPWLGLYGASKAALNHLSETLRGELSPFGVKVVTLMTGLIASNVFKQPHSLDFKLPPGSIYKPIEHMIAARARGEIPVKESNTDEYASDVVGQILSGANGMVWKGSASLIARIGEWCLPQRLWNWLVRQDHGLEKLGS